MNLRGLSVLKSLKTFITGMLTLVKLASIKEVITIKKSSYDHDSLKYEPLSKIKPKDKALMKLSKVKATVKNKSIPSDIFTNWLSAG